jgi:hypothetical protein
MNNYLPSLNKNPELVLTQKLSLEDLLDLPKNRYVK